jgi:hypothetical protein
MILWAGIVVAVMLAVGCAKRGLYETWALAFSSIMAIYIAIFAEPFASTALPSASETPFGNMLVVAGLATGAFIILNGISLIFATGHFSVPFPKILDVGTAGLLGFATGFVLWNFGAFVVCNAPVFPKDFATTINYDERVRDFNVKVFSVPCNAVNMLVSANDSFTTQQAVKNLLDKIAKTRAAKTALKTIKPREPAEPNTLEQKREMIGPPPELESQDG